MNNTREKYRVDIFNMELESLDIQKRQVKIGFAFYSLGTAHKISLDIKIDNEKKMTKVFYRGLLDYLKDAREVEWELANYEYEIANLNKIDEEIKSFFLKIAVLQDKYDASRMTDFDYAMVATNRLDFYNPEFSLNNKSLKEKVDILLKKARADIGDRYYVPAKDLLNKILILDNDSKEVFALKGVCHREMGEMEEAEISFKRWMDLSDPDEKRPYFNYGDILIQLGKYQEAEKVFESYLKIFPDDFDGHIELAQIRYFLGKDYLPLLQKAEKISPDIFREEMLYDFIFHRENSDPGEKMDIKLAAAFLSAEPEYLTNLVEEEIVPFRMIGNVATLFQHELEIWADLMNRFNLLEEKFVINPEAVEKLKKVREAMPSLEFMEEIEARKRTYGRRQIKRAIQEKHGQQRLFDDQ